MEAESSPVAPADYCKPRANELYYRFQSFLKGGPRTTIPDAEGSTDGASGAPALLPVGTHVRLHSLHAQPALNGQAGVLRAFDSQSDRYEVQMCNGDIKRIRAANLTVAAEQESEKGPPPGRGGDVPSAECESGAWEAVDASEAWLRPGERVRVRGLVAREDLNGQEGTLVEYVQADGRWRVHMDDGSGKSLRPPNLEVCCPALEEAHAMAKDWDPHAADESSGAGIKEAAWSLLSGAAASSPPVVGVQPDSRRTPPFAQELAALSSTASILWLCEQAAALTPRDAAQALRRMALSEDRGVMCTDASFSAFLVRSRRLLEESAGAEDLVDFLGAAVEFDLRSLPVLQALAKVAKQQVDRFPASGLALAVKCFAALGHKDIALFDMFASKLQCSVHALSATECVAVARAFASLRLRNFEMLDELSSQVATRLGDLSDEDFAAGLWAFASLDVLDLPLVAKVSAEVSQRAGRLSIGQVAMAAHALAVPAAADAASVREALASRAHKLLEGSSGSQAKPELAVASMLADALPQLRSSHLQEVLLPQANAAAEDLRAISAGGPCVAPLQGLRELISSGGLGVWGTGHVFEEHGIGCCTREFSTRALNRISWASTCVEDWTLQTTWHRRFAFAEYSLGAAKGNLVADDGPRALEPASMLLQDILHGGQVSAAEFCALCRVLCDLHRIGAEATGAVQERVPGRPRLAGLAGKVEVFLTSPPGLAGLLAVRRFQLALPSVALSISIAGEDGSRVPKGCTGAAVDGDSEVWDVGLDDEVMDVELPDNEVMEVVD